MDEFKVIEIKKSVFENNDREADRIRERLKKAHLSFESYVFSRFRQNNYA